MGNNKRLRCEYLKRGMFVDHAKRINGVGHMGNTESNRPIKLILRICDILFESLESNHASEITSSSHIATIVVVTTILFQFWKK